MQTEKWTDYELIATGGGEKLERWGEIILLRPDPQAIWDAPFDLSSYPGLHARYVRSHSGGGRWDAKRRMPGEWTVSYGRLRFLIKPMGFKHTGLFPEQAFNWDVMADMVSARGGRPTVLNLFGYTGGATVACAAAGASVCHVDAARNMVERAGENMRLSGLEDRPVRYIVDDCKKFVRREIRRGRKYDAVVMDPPSYGRGPNGEMWKLENELFPLVTLCAEVLSDQPVFFLINSYTTGLQPQVLKNILALALKGRDGRAEAYEVGLPTEEGIVLPCGCSGLWTKE